MKLISVVQAAVTVALALPGGVAGAGGDGGAACSFAFDKGRVSPPITGTGTISGTFTAGPAPIECTGTIGGKQITGPGTVDEAGTFETATCGRGTGRSTLTVTCPPAGARSPSPSPWSSAGSVRAGTLTGGPFSLSSA